MGRGFKDNGVRGPTRNRQTISIMFPYWAQGLARPLGYVLFSLPGFSEDRTQDSNNRPWQVPRLRPPAAQIVRVARAPTRWNTWGGTWDWGLRV